VELNWTTLLLEIVNFLVLVWLLHRFLYRPVLQVIDRRKRAIEASLADARTAHEEASALQEQYRHRLEHWEQEKANARLRLQEELDRERERRLQQLRGELAQERERARVLEQRRLGELTRHTEERALVVANGFSARLLERLAAPGLETSLIELLLGDLEQLPQPRREAVRAALERTEGAVRVDTAFPLDEAQRERITNALSALAGRTVLCRFGRQPSLQAGVRLSLDHLVLGANLADELRSFFTSGNEADSEVHRGSDRAS